MNVPDTFNMPGQKRKRCSYDVRFKIKVVTYAKENNNNSKAAREFNVTEKLVRDWRKCAAELEELPKTKKACRGRSTPYAADETALLDWVLKNRESGYIAPLSVMSKA